MTVSTTPCFAKPAPSAGWRRLWRVWPLLLLLACGLARAGSIEPARAALVATDDGYALSADFNVDLGHRVEEAVARGVALYFNLEFELTRYRWYWASEHIAGRTLTYRLSYNPLTRQYRLATGSLYRNFDTLTEAVHAMARIGALPVLDKGALKPGETYNAQLRLSLDRNMLPKPFQLDAFANRDWDIQAKTFHWQPSAAAPAPAAAVPAASAGEVK